MYANRDYVLAKFVSDNGTIREEWVSPGIRYINVPILDLLETDFYEPSKFLSAMNIRYIQFTRVYDQIQLQTHKVIIQKIFSQFFSI